MVICSTLGDKNCEKSICETNFCFLCKNVAKWDFFSIFMHHDFVAKSKQITKQAICCVAYCFYCHRIMRRFPSPTSWAPASGTMGITFSHDQNAVGVIILFSFLPLGDFCSTVNLPDKYHLGQVFPILPRASNLLDRSRSVLWYDKTIF